MAGNAGKLPYPPCSQNLCNYPAATKKAWPELVLRPAKECERTITAENPYVTVVYVYRQGGTIDSLFCCNRVYLFIDDESNNCYFIPTVG